MKHFFLIFNLLVIICPGFSQDRDLILAKATTENLTNQKRYALVIGNATYKESPLRNPANDATDIADKLEKMNFDVKLLTNKSKQEMINEINNLGLMAKGYEAVLFFYAGHGIQNKNKNYLIPVDAEMIPTDDELEFEKMVESECVDVDRILAQMEISRCNIKMIVLDACRNNPYESAWRSGSGRGLSLMKAPTGTLIAYSTAPNTVAADGTGRNSPYTNALLKLLDESLLVETLFKRVREEVISITKGRQVPWEATSLTGDFYFKPPPTIAVASYGLDRLKVGQPVNNARIVYTLTNGTFTTNITASNFAVSGLPSGLTVTQATRTSGTEVSINIRGTPTEYNEKSAIMTIPSSVTQANVTGATVAVEVSGKVSVSAVTRGDGATVSTPTVSGTPTQNSITVGAVTLSPTTTGQSAQYAITTNSSSSLPTGLTWQTNTSFSGFPSSSVYYVWARSTANTNYNAGTAQRSTAISTAAAPSIAVTFRGLTNLKVGQAVNNASVVYTLSNGIFATNITASDFAVSGFPPGFTAVTATRISDTEVTVNIRGLPTEYNEKVATIIIPSSVSQSNVIGATVAVEVSGKVSVSAIARGDGAMVSTPSVSERATAIIVGVTLTPATGQSAEYAITKSSSNTAPTSGWQNINIFRGLPSSTTHYVWARSAANTNYNAGTARRSEAISMVVNTSSTEITGTVTSADDGLPLPGVSVVIKGTSVGTVTGVNGCYSINLPTERDILVFSFVGFYTREVDVTARSQDIQVVLIPKPSKGFWYMGATGGVSGFGTYELGELKSGSTFNLGADIAYFFKPMKYITHPYFGVGFKTNVSFCDVNSSGFIQYSYRDWVLFFGPAGYMRWQPDMSIRWLITGSAGVGIIYWNALNIQEQTILPINDNDVRIGGFFSGGVCFMISKDIGIGVNLQTVLGSFEDKYSNKRNPIGFGITGGINYSF